MKKILLMVALPLVALGGWLFTKDSHQEFTGIIPQNSVFEVNYKEKSNNSFLDNVRIEGYVNYFAKLHLIVDVKSKEEIKYSALLDINSMDVKPEISEDVKRIHFSFVQYTNGLVKSITLLDDASDAEHALILNFMANFSHQIYSRDGNAVVQKMFDGELIASYTQLPSWLGKEEVSFIYKSNKKWRVSGGGSIKLENGFYSNIDARYTKSTDLHDNSDQVREINFSLTRLDQLPDISIQGKVAATVVAGTLEGLQLKKRQKLIEMENLILNKKPTSIKQDFLLKKSDGQPWYEYMAYYYVNKDKRFELIEHFNEYPDKRGDIILALASIGDNEAQSMMMTVIEGQDAAGKNDFLRYGVFVEEPSRAMLDGYVAYGDGVDDYSYTSQKILASMYHKYSDDEQYEHEVATLISGLSKATVKEQRHRYSVLGNLGSEQVVSEMKDDLDSTDEDVERLSIDALRFNEDISSNTILLQKASSESSAVRLSALEALRGDYFDSAYSFYKGRMSIEGSKNNRVQLLKNIYALRKTDANYKLLIYQESIDCAYVEICSVAKKMMTEL